MTLLRGFPDDDDAVGRYSASRVDWGALWTNDRTGDDWLAEPLFPRGRSVSVFSRAKAGKSLLMLDVAARLATGRRVLDQPEGDPRRVLYVDAEMTKDDVRERLEELGYGPAEDLGRLAYYVLPALPALDTPEGGAELLSLARGHGSDLIILDTTSRVIAGAENDSDTIRAFYRHTGGPLKAAGFTLVRLDHSGKDPTRGQRGTSAKADDVDIVWELSRREGNQLRLRATHRRLGWVPEVVDLVRLEEPLRHERANLTWPAGTQEVAAALDELGVPLAAGRAVARNALKAAGRTAGNEVLAAALRWRRSVWTGAPDRSTGSPRTGALDIPEGEALTSVDSSAGQVRTASPASTDNPVPPEGDRCPVPEAQRRIAEAFGGGG